MAWSTPSALSTGTLVTAATWNQDVKDNAIALRAGAVAVTSQAIGDILYASSTTQFARVAAVAAGQVLASAGTGTVPAYSATPALTSVDMGGTTVYGSRAITVDTGGVLNIVLASSAGDDFTVDNTRLVVSGDETAVGINTAAPVSLLDVRGPTGTGTAPAGVITLATNELTIVDNDQLGRIEFRSPIATAGTDAIVTAASIWAEANATFSASVNSADIVLATAASGAATEKMRILSTGNVGIGLAAPSQLLEISVASGNVFPRVSTTGSGSAAWRFANGNDEWEAGIRGDLSDAFCIWDIDEAAPYFSLAFNTGFLGLGTTSPTSLLFLSSTASEPAMTIESTIATGGGEKIGGVVYLQQHGGTGEPSQTGDIPGLVGFQGQGNDYNFGGAQIRGIIETGGDITRTAMIVGLQLLTKPSGAAGPTERMRITGAGNVGIGTTDPGSKLTVNNGDIKISDTSTASGQLLFYGTHASYYNFYVGVSAANKISIGSAGVDATPEDETLTELMSVSPSVVNVVGTFTAGTKTFQIPHPLPELKATRNLIHACLEGPRLDLIYRGTVTLVAGSSTVDLDEAAGMAAGTWVLLCRDAQVFTTNETGWFHVRGTVSGSTLTIECEEGTCTDTVSWMVVAERQDDEIKAQSSTDEDGHLILEPLQVEEEPPPDPPVDD
jgi:hypothetical protein